MSKTLQTADAYFNDLQPSIQPLARAVRVLLFEVMPELTEEIKYGLPFYFYQGSVCFINVAKNHLDVGFTAGTELSDSFGLFDQRGLKQIRHIKIPDIAYLKANNGGIANYVIEACVRNETKHVNTSASSAQSATSKPKPHSRTEKQP